MAKRSADETVEKHLQDLKFAAGVRPQTVAVTVTIPRSLMELIDANLAAGGRSGFLQRAAIERLTRLGVIVADNGERK